MARREIGLNKLYGQFGTSIRHMLTLLYIETSENNTLDPIPYQGQGS